MPILGPWWPRWKDEEPSDVAHVVTPNVSGPKDEPADHIELFFTMAAGGSEMGTTLALRCSRNKDAVPLYVDVTAADWRNVVLYLEDRRKRGRTPGKPQPASGDYQWASSDKQSASGEQQWVSSEQGSVSGAPQAKEPPTSPTVKGVLVRCDGDTELSGRYAVEDVPMSHPIWRKGQVAPVSRMVGLPLRCLEMNLESLRQRQRLSVQHSDGPSEHLHKWL